MERIDTRTFCLQGHLFKGRRIELVLAGCIRFVFVIMLSRWSRYSTVRSGNGSVWRCLQSRLDRPWGVFGCPSLCNFDSQPVEWYEMKGGIQNKVEDEWLEKYICN